MENNEQNNHISHEDRYYAEKTKKIQKWIKVTRIFLIVAIPISLIALISLYIYTSANPTIHKPVLYFYPEEELELKVYLKNDKDLLISYPKYISSWNIKAYPDGKITDLNTDKDFYSLYYESKLESKPKVSEEGFVVERENIESFLEEKLEILGLNYKEKEEFIIYWLPKLKENEYTYIRFLTQGEIEESMPITFSTAPDTFIRVWMSYKPLKKPIEVKEQILPKAERKGFTVVEWGATEIKE